MVDSYLLVKVIPAAALGGKAKKFITYDLTKYILDHLKFIVSIWMEDSNYHERINVISWFPALAERQGTMSSKCPSQLSLVTKYKYCLVI